MDTVLVNTCKLFMIGLMVQHVARLAWSCWET